MAKYTIKQIAEAANVSKSTVSRVINNSGYVSKEARTKIEEIIKEGGYTPSAAARTLSRQESNIIGVLLPDPSSYFFSQILSGISEIADKNNAVLIFFNTNYNFSKEIAALRLLAEHNARGVLMTSVVDYYDKESEKTLKFELERLHAPVVFIDRKIERTSHDTVLFDNYNGAFMATEALIDAKFKNIGAICADRKLHLGRERLNGFLEALKYHDMEPFEDALITYEGSSTPEQIYSDSLKLLSIIPKKSAVFLSNGDISNMFLKAVFDQKMVLGRDITCIGFDRIGICDIITNLPFSYVARSEVEMGRVAANLLFERLESDTLIQKEYLIPAILHTEHLTG